MTDLAPRRTSALVGGQAALDFTDAWLANRRLSAHTRAAYRRDVGGWLAWCGEPRPRPRSRRRFLDVNAYARQVEETAAPTTVARKMSGAVQLVRLPGQARAPSTPTRSPAPTGRASTGTTRPPSAWRPRRSTRCCGRRRGDRPDGARTRAALALLADLGLRVGELVSLDVADLGEERGHRSVRFIGKGGKHRRRALTPGTAAAVDAYLAERAATGVRPS